MKRIRDFTIGAGIGAAGVLILVLLFVLIQWITPITLDYERCAYMPWVEENKPPQWHGEWFSNDGECR